MTSEMQTEANRRNALQSTGPRTEQGIEAARFNAMRHGLRSLQTVVPGEAIEEWEAHRAAVVDDLKPAGTVELALAEQIAAKLWRLGRVVRHEAAVIAVGQDRDELVQAHEVGLAGSVRSVRSKQGTTSQDDIREAADAVKSARRKLERRDESIRLLDALPEMVPETCLSWEFAEDLMHAVSLDKKSAQGLERECTANENGFLARHALELLARKGEPAETSRSLAAFWRDDREDFVKAVRRAAARHKRIVGRYEAALERSRLSRGLPDEAALVKIQRYEAHLERGLHKALERLQTLQEARGAVPTSHKPAVAVAVIQSPQVPVGMASFGISGLEAPPAGPGSN